MARRIQPRPALNSSSAPGFHFPNTLRTTFEHQLTNAPITFIPANAVFHPTSVATHIPDPVPALATVRHVQNPHPQQSGSSSHPLQRTVLPVSQHVTHPSLSQPSQLYARQFQPSPGDPRPPNVTNNLVSQSEGTNQVIQQNPRTTNHTSPTQEPPTSTQIIQRGSTPQIISSPNAPQLRMTQPSSNPRIPVIQGRPIRVSRRGRGRRSSRGRGSYLGRETRPIARRSRNLLPNLLRRTEMVSNAPSLPNSTRQTSSYMVGIQEIIRSNFKQQTEVLKSIRDSIEEWNCARQDQSRGVELNEIHQIDSCNPMTTLSNSLCLTYQLFILAAFVGKSPLWFLFPNNEKESQLLEICAGFLKSNDDNTAISLDQERVTIQEFLQGDTVYGKSGVKLWKHKGLIVRSQATRRQVFPLEHRLKRLRSRLHDQMTRTALKPFFSNVPEFQSLRLGVHYSCITSNSRKHALQYCLNKINLGIDPLTDGQWKEAYIRTAKTLMEHGKTKIRTVYRKLESRLSANQLSAVAAYFREFYFQRYDRHVSLLNFDFRPIVPSVLVAYIATKVRCRLGDIGAFEAKENSIRHQPFFEVSACDLHFIPMLGDLIKITDRQDSTPLTMTLGYGCKSERITDIEFTWVKSQYERMVTLSSDFSSTAPDVGINLLHSLIGPSTNSNEFVQNNNNTSAQHNLANEHQSTSSSSSSDANVCTSPPSSDVH